MQKISLVAGARPNFMKIAPVLRVMEQEYSHCIKPVLVHTGQHYDQNMSQAFFEGLQIRRPDYNLNVGSASHAGQTAKIMTSIEEVFLKEKPDIVLVVGDVNSTIAAGLVAKKMNTQLAHVEAGLRSRDRGMPEEINRLATDAITDIFFTTEKEASSNLLYEGHPEQAIHFVGHVMIDNLFFQLEQLRQYAASEGVLELKQKLPENYFCMTLHRPSNVDQPEIIRPLLEALYEIGKEVPIIFPCHPRTRKQIERFSLQGYFTDYNRRNSGLDSGILLLEPLNYNEFLFLWKDCKAVLTDSGGLQEETTALQIPCLTLRDNTERPVTLSQGTNKLVGTDPEKIRFEIKKIMKGETKKYSIPDLWDGRASQRILQVLSNC
jgi:UDP-N-acetylglucosamine 2-epimerase (non-hydrolysing)